MIEFIFVSISLLVVVFSFLFLWAVGITSKEVFSTINQHIVKKLKDLHRELERMGR